MLGFFLLYFAAVFREHLSLAVSVFILILQACFFQISVKSHDVINFWLHWIIFLNLFIFTNFYLWQVNFFTLTRKFCQVVFKKVSNNHSQLKQWSHQFLLLLSFFLTKSSFKFLTNWISIQKQPSRDVLLGGFLWVAPMRRYDFNKVGYASLWGSLFRVGVLLWFLFHICGTLFLGDYL